MGATIAIAAFAGTTFLATVAHYWWWWRQHRLDPVLVGAWLKLDLTPCHRGEYSLELDFSNPGYGVIVMRQIRGKFQVERDVFSAEGEHLRA